MQLLPMHTPAELHRRSVAAGTEANPDVTVAKGPLVIMAYGLMSIDPGERKDCWITGPFGDLTPDEIEEALREWQGLAPPPSRIQ